MALGLSALTGRIPGSVPCLRGNQRQMLIHRDGRRKSGIEAWKVGKVGKSPEKSGRVRKGPEEVRKSPVKSAKSPQRVRKESGMEQALDFQ